MTTAIWEPGIHAKRDEKAVLASLRTAGWDPIPITDPPGFVYPPHRHMAAKLLVILDGSMEVAVAGEVRHCRPGDQLVIPGEVEHAAVVGPDGCRFFWSEQIR